MREDQAEGEFSPPSNFPRWGERLKRSSAFNHYLNFLYPIGGKPQTPELQVGQLTSEDSLPLEPGLKNEEKSLFGSPA